MVQVGSILGSHVLQVESTTASSTTITIIGTKNTKSTCTITTTNSRVYGRGILVDGRSS